MHDENGVQNFCSLLVITSGPVQEYGFEKVTKKRTNGGTLRGSTPSTRQPYQSRTRLRDAERNKDAQTENTPQNHTSTFIKKKEFTTHRILDAREQSEHCVCDDTDEHVAQNDVGVKHGNINLGLLDLDRVQIVEFKGNHLIKHTVDTLLHIHPPNYPPKRI
jgi:hypothetical protein